MWTRGLGGSRLMVQMSAPELKRVCCHRRSSFHSCPTRPEKNSEISPFNAWKLNSYDGIESLTLSEDKEEEKPFLKCPYDVLVRVKASSVNPLDVMMTKGFGAKLLGSSRSLNGHPELPVILGRDFSGRVVDVGQEVKNVRVGQDVWGFSLVTDQGSHASHCVTSCKWVDQKPGNLDYFEASAVPYAGVTAFSALKLSGCGADNKKVLLLGASGGVGHLALQMLKNWKSEVVCTSSEDAMPMLKALGADEVYNYKDKDFRSRLKDLPKFDLILDCASSQGGDPAQNYHHLLKCGSGAYVTLTLPVLNNVDSSGFLIGLGSSLSEIVSENLKSLLKNGTTHRWAFFSPLPFALEELKAMSEQGKLRPLIHSVIPYSSLPDAFRLVEKGGMRGKVVIDHTK